MHVTMRAVAGLPSLRAPNLRRILVDAIAATRRDDARIVHFSIQGDHLHLLVEARDARALTAAIRGLAVRAARAINRLLARRGRVWGDRYYRRDLATPREVRNALVYVLGNALHHGRRVVGLDACSSAPWFDGWSERPAARPPDAPPVSPPETWLLAVGWRRRLGPLRADEAPRRGAAKEAWRGR
jgi:REP element-mobilizing transposase RayT